MTRQGYVPKKRRWMTREERIMITALAGCDMGLHPKRRLVADLLGPAQLPIGTGRITDAQAAAVRTLVVRFRRQLHADVVALAGELAAHVAPAVAT